MFLNLIIDLIIVSWIIAHKWWHDYRECFVQGRFKRKARGTGKQTTNLLVCRWLLYQLSHSRPNVAFSFVLAVNVTCDSIHKLLLGNHGCVVDTLMSQPVLLFCHLFFPWLTLQALQTASANAVTKGAGSEGGACEAFDVDDWMQPSISPSLGS